MKKTNVVKEIAILTLGTIIAAAAVFFFLIPSQAVISSITGLAMVLSNFLPFSISSITFGMNILLLAIGFLLLGREFGAKTIYTSLLLPVILGIFEKLFPNNQSIAGDATLDVVAYILLVSVGLSMLFNANASSGGIDIIAKIMNKYLRMDLGKAMSFAGMCIALSSAFAYDKKSVVLSVIGTYFNGIVLDYFIFGQNIKRRVCIISKKEEEVREFILHELHSGATIHEAKGAYNNQKYNEIITIVDKSEYQKLMNYIEKNDPEAFVTVYTVSTVKYIPKVK